MIVRECPYCGNPVAAHLGQCTHCRESLPPVPRVKTVVSTEGRTHIRRGLLYMLLAAVITYFAGGYSPLPLPIVVGSAVATYLAPTLFLSGLGLTMYGYYRQRKSRITLNDSV